MIQFKLIVKTALRRTEQYFASNPYVPYIIAFQALLILAITELVLGNGSTAETIAVVGFFVLVAGLLIQIGVLTRIIPSSPGNHIPSV